MHSLSAAALVLATLAISTSVYAQSSSSAPADNGAATQKSCGDVATTTNTTGTLDASVLAKVTSITVFSSDDCTGSPTSIESGAQTSLSSSAAVTKAIAAAGYQGQTIDGYALDGTSLTVYVKK